MAERLNIPSTQVAAQIQHRHNFLVERISKLPVSEKFHLENFKSCQLRGADGKLHPGYMMTRRAVLVLMMMVNTPVTREWREALAEHVVTTRPDLICKSLQEKSE